MQEIPRERPITPLLDGIALPSDLRALTPHQLEEVCNQLRTYLLFSVGQSGGHFGAGLGVVELTVVLHYLFDTPKDTLVWDVGHQSYPHKILTGRREQLTRVRHSDGPAPFPMQDESEYDSFGTGHSSTSISAALGMALAKQLQGNPSETVAVIGDGALTAGMAFEALNHAGSCKPNLLVVLNDNAMSISHNVGALSNGFSHFFSSNIYTHTRSLFRKKLETHPELFSLARQLVSQTKAMVLPPSALFEALGCQYFGPVDGHNLEELMHVFRAASTQQGIRVVHVRTVKGKGFIQAEKDPVGFHALGKIAPLNQATKASPKPKFSDVFGKWLCAQAVEDTGLVAITPAMGEGSGMVEFSQLFPARYQDVGIAEQHAITLAAGMACQGMRPVVAIYSTFLQRGYDQLIHDVCLQNLNVTLAVDRAGLVGEDGPTHQGAFDISYLRTIPNLMIGAPSDEAEAYAMLCTAYSHPGPAAVRYPRGAGTGIDLPPNLTPLPMQAKLVYAGSAGKPAILAFGTLLYEAKALAEREGMRLVDMRYIKPLDAAMLKELAAYTQRIVVIEDNAIDGGAGSAVLAHLNSNGWQGQCLCLGIPDRFIAHGSREEQLADAGLDSAGIESALQAKGWL